MILVYGGFKPQDLCNLCRTRRLISPQVYFLGMVIECLLEFYLDFWVSYEAHSVFYAIRYTFVKSNVLAIDNVKNKLNYALHDRTSSDYDVE